MTRVLSILLIAWLSVSSLGPAVLGGAITWATGIAPLWGFTIPDYKPVTVWSDGDEETPWELDRLFEGNYWVQGINPKSIRAYWQQYLDAKYGVGRFLAGFPEGKVQIAILDTGADDRISDLKIDWFYDVTGAGKVDKVGHGTFITSLVGALKNDFGLAGVASEFADIYVIKVGKARENSPNPRYLMDWILKGFEKAREGPDGINGTDDDADVISLSFGNSGDMLKGLHGTITKYVNVFNIPVVAALGNEPLESVFPADWEEVIAVGGVDQYDEVYIGRGTSSHVELVAPAVDVIGYYPIDASSPVKIEPIADTGTGTGTLATLNYMGRATGTSFAAPLIASILAFIIWLYGKLPVGTLEDQSWSTLRGILHTMATDLGAPGRDPYYGWGLLTLTEKLLQIDPLIPRQEYNSYPTPPLP